MSDSSEQYRPEHEYSIPGYKQVTLQYRDQQLALLLTGERGRKFDWDKFKWTPTDLWKEGIVSTLSGNDFYIYTGAGNTYIVNTGESERTGALVAAAKPFPAQLPPIAFGEPWNIPGFYQTSDVESILLGYKMGDIGHKIDEPIPFEKYRHYFKKPGR